MVALNNWLEYSRGRIYIHESILFRFPENRDNTIVTNYSILYAKQFIYREKLKDKNKHTNFIIDFLGYLSFTTNI